MSLLDEARQRLMGSGMTMPDMDYENYYMENSADNAKVKQVVDFFDELEDYAENGDKVTGAKLPFSNLSEKFGFREGEVTLWTGYNGHKKSMFAGYVFLNFIKQGEKCCIASFEMKPVKTIIRMARQYTLSKFAGGSEIGDFMAFAHDNLFLFDHMGGITPERLYGVILYATKELGVKHFLIDSLMRVIAGEDNYNAQKDFVVRLCEIASNTNSHIHLVHHTKKGKEENISGRYDAKGSGAIGDNVHNSLVVWSNKDGNEEMPDVALKCDKQREGEWEGILALNFMADTLTFEQKHEETRYAQQVDHF